MGVELNYNYGGTNHMAEDNQYSGEVIQAGLEKAAAELGVDVRTGTKGMDLVMEDGVCKGVVVTNNANETYVPSMPRAPLSQPAASAPTRSCLPSMRRATRCLIPLTRWARRATS